MNDKEAAKQAIVNWQNCDKKELIQRKTKSHSTPWWMTIGGLGAFISMGFALYAAIIKDDEIFIGATVGIAITATFMWFFLLRSERLDKIARDFIAWD